MTQGGSADRVRAANRPAASWPGTASAGDLSPWSLPGTESGA